MSKNRTTWFGSSWSRRAALLAVLGGLGMAALPEAEANSGIAWNRRNGAWCVLSSGAPLRDLEHTAVNKLRIHCGITATDSISFKPFVGKGWSAIAVNKRTKKIAVSVNKASEAAAIRDALAKVGKGGEIRVTWRDYNISRKTTGKLECRNY